MRDQALAVCGSARPAATANYGATSLTTLLQMVAYGQGVTLIPEMALPSSEAIPDLKVVPFAEPMPSRRLAFAWRRNASRQGDCEALAAAIRALWTGSAAGEAPGEQKPHQGKQQHTHANDGAAVL